jgi:hypothetical protein
MIIPQSGPHPASRRWRAYRLPRRASAPRPEQDAVARKLELARLYVPMIPTVHRLNNDFVQPW